MENDKLQELKLECEKLMVGYTSRFCPSAKVKIIGYVPLENQCRIEIETTVDSFVFSEEICVKDKADFVYMLPGVIMEAFKESYHIVKTRLKKSGCAHSEYCKYFEEKNNAEKNV